MPREIAKLVSFFKALADTTRLQIVGLLALEERTVDELATLVDVRAPTVSHHLAKLKKLGLVKLRQDGNRRWYQLNAERVESFAREVLASDGLSQIGDEVEASATETKEMKSLRPFMDGDRFVRLPVKWSKKKLAIHHIARRLDHDKIYTEDGLNAAIEPFYEDFATVRRLLVELDLMTRDRAGRAYTFSRAALEEL